jgi:protein-disulfide isomerase
MKTPLRAAVLLVVACGAELPSQIRSEIDASPKGVATVVMFTDFQCPFCRRTHAALAPVLAENKGRVRVVVHHVPLARHPDARGAANAAICVESLAPSATLEYAHALFTSQDLSDRACEDLAMAHGVDRDRFRACLTSSATAERIARDAALFDAIDGEGVPLTFIGKKRLDGAQPESALRAAIDSAH